MSVLPLQPPALAKPEDSSCSENPDRIGSSQHLAAVPSATDSSATEVKDVASCLAPDSSATDSSFTAVKDIASCHASVNSTSSGVRPQVGDIASTGAQTGVFNDSGSAQPTKTEEVLNRAVRRRSRCKSPGPPAFHAVLCSDHPAPVQRLLFDDVSTEDSVAPVHLGAEIRLDTKDKIDDRGEIAMETPAAPTVTSQVCAVVVPWAEPAVDPATVDPPADTLAGLVAAAMQAPKVSHRAYSRMSAATLRELCREAKIPSSGTKAAMIARLLASGHSLQGNNDLDLLPSPSKTLKEPPSLVKQPSSKSGTMTSATVEELVRGAPESAARVGRPKGSKQPAPRQKRGAESGTPPAKRARSATNAGPERCHSPRVAKARGRKRSASLKPTFGTPQRRARSCSRRR